MTTFGSDFSAFDDIDANWTFLDASDADETLAVAQAVARRYITPRGGNPWDPGYGYALVLLIGSSTQPAAAVISIEAEARKDERVADCKATVTVTGDVWTVNISCTLINGGTFSLTLLVSQLTVELLKVGT